MSPWAIGAELSKLESFALLPSVRSYIYNINTYDNMCIYIYAMYVWYTYVYIYGIHIYGVYIWCISIYIYILTMIHMIQEAVAYCMHFFL